MAADEQLERRLRDGLHARLDRATNPYPTWAESPARRRAELDRIRRRRAGRPMLLLAAALLLSLAAGGAFIVGTQRRAEIAPSMTPAASPCSVLTDVEIGDALASGVTRPGASPSGVGIIEGQYQIVGTPQQPVTPDILEETCQIVTQRLGNAGFSVALVTTAGTDRILVFLRQPVDLARARTLVGATGRLEFIGIPGQYVDQVIAGQPLPSGLADLPSCSSSSAGLCTLFGGDQLAAARAGTDSNGQPALDLVLKSEGAAAFDAYAETHLQGEFAIVLDGTVLAAPTIQAAHYGGQAQITGPFAQDLNDVLAVLDFGSLPLEIRELSFGEWNP